MKNQTNSEYLLDLNEDALGTGLFLVPDPTQLDFGAGDVVEVLDITYPSCLLRGYFTLAFKWIPNRTEYNRDIACSGLCVDYCVQPGCICHPITGKCVYKKQQNEEY